MNLRGALQFLEDAESRRKGIRIWIAVVLLWSIGRSIIVGRVFQQYGLNPAIYFSIDFLSSIPYAHASAQSLLTYLDKKGAQSLWWGLLTILAFYTPDIYIVAVSNRVPPTTYLGFAIILALLSTLAFVQWKAKRR